MPADPPLKELLSGPGLVLDAGLTLGAARGRLAGRPAGAVVAVRGGVPVGVVAADVMAVGPGVASRHGPPPDLPLVALASAHFVVLLPDTPRAAALARCREAGAQHVVVMDAAGRIRGTLGLAGLLEGAWRAERAALAHRAAMEGLIAEVLAGLVEAAAEDMDAALSRSLAAIGRFVEADRCAIYQFRESEGQMWRTHGWAAPGCEPAQPLRRLPLGRFSWAMARLRALEPLQIPSRAELPAEARAERALLEAEGVHSLVVVPLVCAGVAQGFVGVASLAKPRRWSGVEAGLLRVLAEAVSAALQRQAAEAALRRAHADLEAERASLERRVEERTAELSVANAELACSARAKDEFLAAMSHELRTPLTAVLGLTEVLLEQTHGPLNPLQHRYLATIEESGRHLLELINDVLDVAKIEAGQLALEYAPVPVQALCEASLRLVKRAAEKKRLKVSLTVDGAMQTLRADRRRLKQVLVNLLNNAVKFTPEGGAIGLDASGDAQAERATFSVWDTGIGIAEEAASRLFRPFVQLDGRLARQYGGSGLGLVLVYRMIQMHGGSVTLDSEVGHGTRFTVALPWREEGDGRPNGTAARRTAGAAVPSVLVVEHTESSIARLSAELEAGGHRVVVVRDGVEALARGVELGPAAVVVDLQVPGLDGVEVLRRLRAESRLADVPMVALTALMLPETRRRAEASGADAVLSFPLAWGRLLRAIRPG